jgi:hypothetical protein
LRWRLRNHFPANPPTKTTTSPTPANASTENHGPITSDSVTSSAAGAVANRTMPAATTMIKRTFCISPACLV